MTNFFASWKIDIAIIVTNMLEFAKITFMKLSAMHQLPVSLPDSEDCLLQRANALAGMSLGELSERLNEATPVNLLRAKGWVGQLLEKALGASAGNLDLPDFPQLGIELKTLPINPSGHPQESTYLCRVSLPLQQISHFYESRVWRKCARILWVPIQADTTIPLAQRRIGTALLWSPCAHIESILKQDWEELTDMMRFGQFEQLSAHHGVYLQLRPKAANAKVCVNVTNDQGKEIAIVPKGFYLRPSLTQQILQAHYALA